METNQALLQNALYANDDAKTLALIKTLDLQPNDLAGNFSIAAYNGKIEIVKALLAKCNPPSEEVDASIADSLLTLPEMVKLLLPLHPSKEAMGRLIADAHMNFCPITNEQGITTVPSYEKYQNFAETIGLFSQANATIQEWSRVGSIIDALENGNQIVVDKYYDRKIVLPGLLDFALRHNRKKSMAFALAQPIDYQGDEGYALLCGAIAGQHDELIASAFENNVAINHSGQPSNYGVDRILFLAITTNNIPVLKKLVALRAKEFPGQENAYNQGNYSEVVQSVEMLAAIKACGFEIHKNEEEYLMRFVQNNKIELAQYILEDNADVHAQKNKAMKMADEVENADMIELLASFGAEKIKHAPYDFKINIVEASITELWVAWIGYYKKNMTNAELIGATDAEIANFENETHFVLPDDVKAIYKISNGGEKLFFGLNLIPLAQIVQDPMQWKSVLDSLMEGDNENFVQSIYPENTVRKQYINLRRWPFASDGTSNFLNIDNDPGVAGTKGQIINSGRDQQELVRMTANVTEFTRKVLLRVAANKTQLKSDGNFYLFKNGQGILNFNDVKTLMLKGEW